MSENCPVCQKVLNHQSQTSGHKRYYSCQMCGEFVLPIPGLEDLHDAMKDIEDAPAILSHAIRKRCDDRGEQIDLTPEMVTQILRDEPLPKYEGQRISLIRWLGKNTDSGEAINIPEVPFVARVGVKDERKLGFIVSELVKDKILEQRSGQRYRLTGDGWARYQKIVEDSSESVEAFMAMHFGKDDVEREEMDNLYKILKKWAMRTGFELVRIDKKPKIGSVPDHIKEAIGCARFMVADLTYKNPGVFWEAGFAIALGKPVLYSCRRDYFDDAGTHFDVQSDQTLIWNPNNLEEAGKQFQQMILNSIPEAKVQDEATDID